MNWTDLAAEAVICMGGCLLCLLGLQKVISGQQWAWVLVGTGLLIIYLVDSEEF